MIELEHVTKRYFLTRALKDLSLRVETGRVIGVLGENGSGKSTLFKILAGVARPSSGQVRLMGHPVGIETRRFTSYLPEINPFYGWMRVGEQLDFLANFYPGWDQGKAAALLGLMGLSAEPRIGELSRGQQARLKVVSAFAWPSQLVLMDEPLSSIDPPSRRRIIQALFEEYRAGEQTVLISTHLVSEVEEVVEDVVFLRRGEIALQGNVDQLRQEKGKSLMDIFEEVAI
ncbi:MAG: ABC transporter ATP-binding protein [Candidatus Latescibacteria bacterium]|nr:ABC transporter ATP-binding protein [Candidatus Latescibacterota bacterium]